MIRTSCIKSVVDITVRNKEGIVKNNSTKEKNLTTLMKRIQIFGPDGKLKNDTGIIPSHSYTKQFLQIIEAISSVTTVSAKRVTGVTAAISYLPDWLDRVMKCSAALNDSTHGIVVGTGTDAEANDNYKLGTQVAHGTGSGQLIYGPVTIIHPATSGANTDFTINRSFINMSGDDIETFEFGIYVKMYNDVYCIIRDYEAGGKTVVAGDTMTVQYILRTGAGVTQQFLESLYPCFRTIYHNTTDIYGVLSNVLYAGNGSTGPGITGNSSGLQFCMAPTDASYVYSQQSHRFGVQIGDAGDGHGLILGWGEVTHTTSPASITIYFTAGELLGDAGGCGLGNGQHVSISGTGTYLDGSNKLIGNCTETGFHITYVGETVPPASGTGAWSIYDADEAEAPDNFHLQHRLLEPVYGATSFVTTTEVAGVVDFVVSRTFYNGTASAVSFREVGIAWTLKPTYSYVLDFALILRDLLASDVVIDPGDTATVQYTLRTDVAV